MKQLLLALAGSIILSPVFAQSEYSSFTATGRGGATTFVTDYQAVGINPAGVAMPNIYGKKFAMGYSEFTFSMHSSALTKDELRTNMRALILGDTTDPFTQEEKINAAKHKILPAIKAVLGATPIKGRITLSGYEGSELLVARLLIESGADVRYVGSACPRTVWSDADRQWLEAKGVQVQFRASLEQDLAAMAEFQPDLAIGTTPVVQAAKQASIPSLYFTNLISARPLMGPAGAGSLAQVINAAIGNQARFDEMKAFFGDVGAAHNAGVWEGIPKDRPEFKAETRRKLEKAIKKRKAEEMI